MIFLKFFLMKLCLSAESFKNKYLHNTERGTLKDSSTVLSIKDNVNNGFTVIHSSTDSSYKQIGNHVTNLAGVIGTLGQNVLSLTVMYSTFDMYLDLRISVLATHSQRYQSKYHEKKCQILISVDKLILNCQFERIWNFITGSGSVHHLRSSLFENA